MEDGSLVLEVESPPKNGLGVSSWLYSWTEIRTGWVGGQHGGQQSHLRLNDGKRNLVLYEGEDGSLADRPGRTYAGVAEVGWGGVADIGVLAECEATATNRSLLHNIRRQREAAKLPPLPDEVENGPFDAWY